MHISVRLCAALAAALLISACVHVPTEKEAELAQIDYDLGIQAQQAGDIQSAWKNYEKAIELNPGFPEPYMASGVLLHLAFKRPDEAVVRYKRALALRPDYSETKVNLANVYVDLARYDEAIALYEEALNDMLYKTPFLAQANLGWALYKRGKAGDAARAVEMLKSAVTTNPKFCLGYKDLGIVQFEKGATEEACGAFDHYKERCPDVADAYYRAGMCAAKLGKNELAKTDFATCQTKAAQNETMREDCKRMLGLLQ